MVVLKKTSNLCGKHVIKHAWFPIVQNLGGNCHVMWNFWRFFFKITKKSGKWADFESCILVVFSNIYMVLFYSVFTQNCMSIDALSPNCF